MSTEKKIILISNMYPTEKHPSFGAFVKNTEVLLNSESLYTVDKVVISENKRGFRRLLQYVLFYFELNYKLLTSKYDSVYVHNLLHPVLMLYPFVFFTKKAIFLNAHGSDLTNESIVSNIIRFLISPIVKRAGLIITPSLFAKKLVQSIYGLEESVVVFPSGGVDIEDYRPKNKKKSNEVVFGFISRIEYEKGWDLFIQSAQALRSLGKKNVRFLIAGSGGDTEKMLSEIADKNLGEYVLFIGEIPREDVSKFYKKLDALIFPTRYYESLGLVGIEAMACSVPVIGSGRGGMASYLEDSYNGYTFDVECKASLTSKLDCFLELDPLEKEKLRKNAHSTSLKFDAKKVSAGLAFQMRKVIDKKSARN